MQGDELEIERQVIKVLSDYFPVGRRAIEASSRLVEDLYVDSINIVEVVMILNDVFDVELPQAEVAKWRVVNDICSLVVCSKTNLR
ncbi:hypothetical protein HK44_022860 [Pseudomonas fluorescens HK44]|uniref:Carrier domain-containing protein n=1 Tax=Pseudomonas fluorescens HK44 TaxID=1042209 RepID=A0A010T0B4_PSEFL|nr:phosphopantetheine-binding protein [Pseudomonas fluorescens]EXF96348.1 hypothetical protein HK44_022860 [Pseudomonas fluorescens HK44]